MKPTVSVQIVTFNSEEDIEKCLKAVENQSYPINRLLVIDNNSDDNTLLKVQSFENVEIIKNEKNVGFAQGHNQGIFMTNTDYILVLNPDVQLHEKYIEYIVEALEANTSIGMATGKLYRNMEKQIMDSTGIQMKKNRRAIDRGTGEIDTGQYDTMNLIFGVSGAAAIYKRELISSISINREFFDESFFAYKEDVDVSWRAQILGWESLFVNKAIAMHSRGWKEDKKRSEIPVYIRQKSYMNRYFYIVKNDQLTYYMLHLPFILFFELASFFYTVLKERELLSSWKFIIKQWKSLKLKRAFIMSNRKKSNKQIYSYFKGLW